MNSLILGIDPGLTRCGYGLVQRNQRRELEYLSSGVLLSDKDEALQDRLLIIGEGVAALMDTHHPVAISLERVFSQQNLHSVMSIAQISGVILYEAAKRNIPVVLYTPTQVKAAVSGYGKAEKKQVATMVSRILRLNDFVVPADESDALALAICHLHQSPLGALQVPAAAQQQTNTVKPTDLRSTQPRTALTPAQEKWLAAERQSKAK
ncbi:MAG: crossover junction endodeoxyribonuclease RuvC [Microbacteriaceae bacterium]